MKQAIFRIRQVAWASPPRPEAGIVRVAGLGHKRTDPMGAMWKKDVDATPDGHVDGALGFARRYARACPSSEAGQATCPRRRWQLDGSLSRLCLKRSPNASGTARAAVGLARKRSASSPQSPSR